VFIVEIENREGLLGWFGLSMVFRAEYHSYIVFGIKRVDEGEYVLGADGLATSFGFLKQLRLFHFDA